MWRNTGNQGEKPHSLAIFREKWIINAKAISSFWSLIHYYHSYMLQLFRRGFSALLNGTLTTALVLGMTIGIFESTPMTAIPLAHAACTLTVTNVEPALLTAGSTSQATVTFTNCSPVNKTNKILITFPLNFDVSGATGGACSSMGGSPITSVLGQTVTLDRNNTGSNVGPSSAQTCTINGIKNPTFAGSTGVYGITITNSADTLEQNDAAVTADTITPNVLSATNVQPAALDGGTTNQVAVSFTTTNALAIDDKIKVTFGTDFNVSGATGGTCSSMNGTFLTSVAGQIVTLTRQSNGTPETAAAESCTINGIANPSSPGSTGTYTIQTTTSTDAIRDQDTAVAADTITADVTDPTVTGVSTAHADGAFTTGEVIDITVAYDEVVIVTGTPTLALNTGTNASFFSGTGTNTLTFRYTVAGGQTSADLDYNATNSLALSGGTIKDAANNNAVNTLPAVGTFGGAHAIVIDTTAPTVTIDQDGGQTDPANAASSPLDFDVVFSESVTGFDGADITISGTAGATTVGVTGSGTTYTVEISGMTSDGTVIVNVNAGGATDAAGNTNAASTSTDNTVTYEGTPPNVTLTSGAANPTNSSTISVTATFSEDVTDFLVGDISVGNGSAGNFNATSATVYTFDITPNGDGNVTVDVGAGAAQDSVGNNNNAAVTLSRTYDGTSPTIGFSTSLAGSPFNNTLFNFNVGFSESVTGFDLTDVVIGNGTPSNLSGTGANYSFDVVPTSNGLVTVDINAGGALDAAGNGNTASAPFSATYDGTAPSVSMSSVTANTTNANPIAVTVTFSESVTGFTSGDLALINSSANNFAGSGDTYTFDLVPAGQGLVTVNIAAGVAEDAATNGNTIATQFTRTFDSVVPTVTLNTISGDPTNTSPIAMIATFSEIVTGFTSGAIVPTNGTVSNFAGGGASYTFDLVPTSDGPITVDVAGSVAQDAAGNNNSAATQFTITYDTTAPTVALTSGAADPLSTSPFNVTVTFSENVTGFVVGGVTVSNGTPSNLLGGPMVYTVDISPTASGLVTVDVPGSGAQDTAGNNNSASNSLTRTFDTIQPTVTLSTTSTDPTNVSTIPVTVTFSETVTGFDSSDVTTSNGTVNNFNGSGSSYSFDLVAGGEGAVTAKVFAGAADDSATPGNVNLDSNLLSITFDSTQPTVTIDQDGAQTDPTNVSPINFTVVFSENVTGFDDADITLSGTAGATTSVVSGGPATYNVAVSGMTSAGTVIADVNAGIATDAANNGNTSSTSTDNNVSFDATAPGILNVTSTTADGSYGPGSIITITVTFTEIVTVTGTPQLTLETGATDAVINLTGGSGTDTLSFDYTVGANESASDLDYFDTLALALNGGTIQDILGNNATLTPYQPQEILALSAQMRALSSIPSSPCSPFGPWISIPRPSLSPSMKL